MSLVVIAYHSGYGHTKKVAEHVLKGAQSVAGTSAKLINVEEVGDNFDDFNAATAIIFGCPTYMGGPSAAFKAFIDKCSKLWFQQAWKNKLAAGFTNSGSYSGDKLNTLTSLWVNAMQHSMVWIGTGMLPAAANTPAGPGPDEVNRLGSFGGLMTASANGQPLDQTPPPGDLKTAELFGARVATIAKTWKPG